MEIASTILLYLWFVLCLLPWLVCLTAFVALAILVVVEIARMPIRALHNLAIYCGGRAASCGRLRGSDDQFLRKSASSVNLTGRFPPPKAPGAQADMQRRSVFCTGFRGAAATPRGFISAGPPLLQRSRAESRNLMPPWGNTLNERQVRYLVAYLRTLGEPK